jgi:DNA protecting protein DprA
MLGVGAGPDGVGDGGWEVETRRPVSMSRADRDAIAVLLSVHGLGPLTLGRLVEALGSPAGVLAAAAAGARAASGLVAATRTDDGEARAMPLSVADAIVVAAARRESILADVEREGLRVVAQGDAEYPDRLLAIDIPPPALFVRGSLAALGTQHAVGVVGTRRPSPAGRRIASRIGTALARAGATVVSGLAVGIDGAAHAAAVAERSPTIAFIGGGHGRLFPRAHDRLADAIVDGGGAVVSEYAPMIEPSKGTFPQRNRLISGSADAVVVVEAGARSGALLTASWALEHSNDLSAARDNVVVSHRTGYESGLTTTPRTLLMPFLEQDSFTASTVPAVLSVPASAPRPGGRSRQASTSSTPGRRRRRGGRAELSAGRHGGARYSDNGR